MGDDAVAVAATDDDEVADDGEAGDDDWDGGDCCLWNAQKKRQWRLSIRAISRFSFSLCMYLGTCRNLIT